MPAKRLYEGMFLVDSARASSNLKAVVSHIHGVLKENGSEIAQSERWDERKLIYDIKKVGRGTYFLVHFNAPPSAIGTINREFRLSGQLLRHMILVDEHVEAPIGRLLSEDGDLIEPPAPEPEPEPAPEPESPPDAADAAAEAAPEAPAENAAEDEAATGELNGEEAEEGEEIADEEPAPSDDDEEKI